LAFAGKIIDLSRKGNLNRFFAESGDETPFAASEDGKDVYEV
jgi:hypothetical protein